MMFFQVAGALFLPPLSTALILFWAVSAVGNEPTPKNACHRELGMPRGEMLAQAEDLRESAQRFRRYDYDLCYRLGRSCLNEVDSKMISGVENAAYRGCQVTQRGERDRSNYSKWLHEKQAFITCMIAEMEKQAKELEHEACDLAKIDKVTLERALVDLKQLSGPLDAPMLKRLTKGSIWCSTQRPRRKLVLCGDGTGAVAEGERQLPIIWKITSERKICFLGFDAPWVCYSVSVNNGLLDLSGGDTGPTDIMRVVPDLNGIPGENCPQ